MQLICKVMLQNQFYERMYLGIVNIWRKHNTQVYMHHNLYTMVGEKDPVIV